MLDHHAIAPPLRSTTMASGETIRNVPLMLYSPASMRRHHLPTVGGVGWQPQLTALHDPMAGDMCVL
jgi:hypothetical protein